ncbi:MAG: right-handed parallel beta-helix repeat-containing protein [bacterium]|nr:right-handed parallel beta-helix repeat-containing protein [bacterium]
MFPIVFKNGIRIISRDGVEFTIIDAGYSEVALRFPYLDDTLTTLKGFTIKHSNRSGIICLGSSPFILENTIMENTYNGIYCEGGSLLIKNNKFKRNNYPDIWLGYEAYAIIDSNEFDSSISNSVIFR